MRQDDPHGTTAPRGAVPSYAQDESDPSLRHGAKRTESSGPGPQRSRSRRSRFGIGFLVLLCLALLGTNLFLMSRVLISQPDILRNTGKPSGGDAAPARTVTPTGKLSDFEETTVEIFKRNAPSVAFITTVSLREDWLRRNVTEIPSGTGSGFVWDDKGHVVTNFHVVQGSNGARVTLSDQSVWKAKMVGFSPDNDLAVLKIEVPSSRLLTPLALGESHNLVVGQHVFAIGNPFGFDHTLSTGVISGLNREITSVSRRPIQDVIQTDAAINPGNSGGPLLDSHGRLIGVNTAIYSPSGAYAGIGFAVPADTVARIVPQLIQHGKVIRPWLGIQIADAAIGKRFGVEGVLVLGVVDGSPAARVGIKPVTRNRDDGAWLLGDVIVAIDGEPLAEPDDLFRVLDRKEVGDEVVLKLKRGKQTQQVKVSLGTMPDNN